jgi:glycosyltransferase involved in cell wall biosynthesis
VEETVASVEAQTHPAIEIVVVNDGSLRDEDGFLLDWADAGRIKLVNQVNTGLSAARNTGATLARGEFVLPLDADDVIAPTFVERCLEALERDPQLAYATTWVRYVLPDGTPMISDESGYHPYGNWSRLIERNNVGGTCAALMRRRIFERGFRWNQDLTSFEDWLLYLELSRAGLLGAVVPERLFDYRVRPDSMMRTDGRPLTGVIVGEIAAHLRESEVEWTSRR